jgi:hypothetical protein
MSQLYEASQLRDDRVRSVRHAEYMLLNTLSQRDALFPLSFKGGLNRPFYDAIEEKRCVKAVANMRKIFQGMMEKRVKYLPLDQQEEHNLEREQ